MSEPTRLKAVAAGAFCGAPLAVVCGAVGALTAISYFGMTDSKDTIITIVSFGVMYLVGMTVGMRFFKSAKRFQGSFALGTVGTTMLTAAVRFLA